jgi:hypothetical protein
VFEAVVETEAAGSYSIAVSRPVVVKNAEGKEETGTQIVGRTALAVPYSPEFATVKSNEGLLQQVAGLTKGRVIEESALAQANLFDHDLPATRTLKPVWHWLVFVAALLLLFDVMVRRIAIQPAAISAKVSEAYRRLRGTVTLSEQSQQYFERLKSKKAGIGEQLEKAKATRRFEGTVEQAAVLESPRPRAGPPGANAPGWPEAVPEARPVGAADDFAARLMKAKQKAREQIEGEKHKEES